LRGIVDFLIDTQILQIASDPRVMFAAGALFLISLFMRWRIVALSLFGVAALVAVVRYSKLSEGSAALDQNMVVFVIGSVLVIAVLIYFLFIRGD
jgi:multisubunit Na+/H+ antiporter MnhF subunit